MHYFLYPDILSYLTLRLTTPYKQRLKSLSIESNSKLHHLYNTCMVWAVPVSLAATQGMRFVKDKTIFSIPPGTKMFQFPGLSSCTYVFSTWSSGFARRGFPIRKSPGQRLLATSPKLIAGCCVLHRLSMSRHPPYTLELFHHKNGTYMRFIAIHLYMLVTLILDCQSPSPTRGLWSIFVQDRSQFTSPWKKEKTIIYIGFSEYIHHGSQRMNSDSSLRFSWRHFIKY